MKVRAFISYVVFVALVTTWSAGFGSALYQACPADCCSSVKDRPACAHGLGDQSNAVSVVSMTGDRAADACSCNSTCDATCSECMYFHAGAVMQVVSLTLSSAIFAFSPPEGSLQHHPSRTFRPPPTPLA